ncbi:ribonuclease P protein subunit p30 [Epargyreus clarus]|uniref:ribonuclease P protein subunit p30 n=1 Tax=Epargyreus clarus TaxID=520877 RepID=UPI003C2E0397
MAFQNYGFCDLSLNRTFDLNKLSLIEKYGFNTVAINTFVEDASDEPKKKKKKSDQNNKDKKDLIPAPIEIPQDVKENCKLNILQRLTLEFSDTSVAHKINQSENIKKYDIFAVLPKTLQAFQFACSTLDVDVVTFEPESKTPFKISRKLYRQAADRGMCFELMYSPAIKDSTARKNIISTAHTYHAIGKSRNIILTSGAESPSQVRSVHEVINLGFILGLNSNQSLEVIRNNARNLILKALSRRCGKHFMIISPSESNENKTVEE